MLVKTIDGPVINIELFFSLSISDSEGLGSRYNRDRQLVAKKNQTIFYLHGKRHTEKYGRDTLHEDTSKQRVERVLERLMKEVEKGTRYITLEEIIEDVYKTYNWGTN